MSTSSHCASILATSYIARPADSSSPCLAPPSRSARTGESLLSPVPGRGQSESDGESVPRRRRGGGGGHVMCVSAFETRTPTRRPTSLHPFRTYREHFCGKDHHKFFGDTCHHLHSHNKTTHRKNMRFSPTHRYVTISRPNHVQQLQGCRILVEPVVG